MAPTKDGLKVLPPAPVGETEPLLGDANGQPPDQGAIERQAEQERREHDTNSVPIADEPSTKKLLFTMGSLWLSTFFAALGAYSFIIERELQSNM